MRAPFTDKWDWSCLTGLADDQDNPGPELAGDLAYDPMEDFSEPEAERYDPEAGSESSEWNNVPDYDHDQDSDNSGLESEPDESGLPQDTLPGDENDSSESGRDSISMRDVDTAASVDNARDGEGSDTTWNGFSDGFEESDSDDEDEQDPSSVSLFSASAIAHDHPKANI